ncbi:MAG TPA: hypothetical protein VIN74_04235 [Candidatus Limnocylindria bacterium]|jgi:hypothetical protein
MFRTIRTLIIAVIVAASLAGSATVASADPGPHKAHAHTVAPQPIHVLFDITWE